MILLILILIPFFGALLSFITFFINSKYPRYMAILSVSLCLLISLFLFLYNYNFGGINFIEKNFIVIFYKSWFPEHGISFYLGMDKLSLLMIFLTSLLGFFSVFYEWDNIDCFPGMFYFFLLFMMFGFFGIFLSFDMFLFFVFWEIILIPMYFFVFFWGSRGKKRNGVVFAANKFFIYSQLSSFIFLFFIIHLSCIYHSYSGIWTFNYFVLKNIHVSLNTEIFLMFCLSLSFMIKMPVVPFHSWLPDVQKFLPVSNSVDFMGIVLKPAIYGLLRFSLVFFPRAHHKFSFFFACLGLFSVLYGSIMAFSQKNIKKLIAYSSISSMGMIFAALNCANIFSYQGVILYSVSYILSSSALLILINKIVSHIKTQNISYMNGLWSYMQLIPSFFLFFIFVNSNFPITGNFSGEFMMLMGILTCFPKLGCLFIFSVFFSSIYSVFLIQRVFFGSTDKIIVCNELNYFDLIILIILIFLILLLGLHPQFFLKFSYEISKKLC